MQIKTSELMGAALDWVVYECEKLAMRTDVYMRWYGDGRRDAPHDRLGPFRPSSDWSQGGPIVEREGIDTKKVGITQWMATLSDPCPSYFQQCGVTPLIAAMRCYVASKLGDVVDVPEELLCKP